MVSQGYDGASVMSGQCSGVQKRIRELAPHAIYIHCYAHTLNLVLVDSVKMVPYVTEFFALLESLYVFISTTKAHAIFHNSPVTPWKVIECQSCHSFKLIQI